jgi:hypothetical protein
MAPFAGQFKSPLLAPDYRAMLSADRLVVISHCGRNTSSILRIVAHIFGSPNIHCMAEPAAEHQPDNEHDKQQTHDTHTPVPVVTAAIAVESAAPEQQDNNDNQKKHNSLPPIYFERRLIAALGFVSNSNRDGFLDCADQPENGYARE